LAEDAQIGMFPRLLAFGTPRVRSRCLGVIIRSPSPLPERFPELPAVEPSVGGCAGEFSSKIVEVNRRMPVVDRRVQLDSINRLLTVCSRRMSVEQVLRFERITY
jgi:hypothetical protein